MEGGIKDKAKTLEHSNMRNDAINRSKVDGIEQGALPKTWLPNPVRSLALCEFTQSQPVKTRSLFVGRGGQFYL